MRFFVLFLVLMGGLFAYFGDYKYMNMTTNITNTGALPSMYKSYPAPIRVFFYDAPREANVGFFQAYGKDWGIYIKRDYWNKASTLTHELCHYRQFVEDREYDDRECCQRAMMRWC